MQADYLLDISYNNVKIRKKKDWMNKQGKVMSKGTNQKLKLIYLIKIMLEKKELFEQFDIAAYTKKNFGMYGGEEQSVKLEFDNNLIGVVIDRFGKDIIIAPADDTHFVIHVNVAVSDQFLGWIFALGDGARILGPENVVEHMKLQAQKNLEKYK